MTAFDRRIRVVLLVLAGSVFFDIGTVLTVFGPGRPGTARPDLGYALVLATAVPGSVTTSAGVPVHVDAGLDALEDADLVTARGCMPDRGPRRRAAPPSTRSPPPTPAGPG